MHYPELRGTVTTGSVVNHIIFLIERQQRECSTIKDIRLGEQLQILIVVIASVGIEKWGSHREE